MVESDSLWQKDGTPKLQDFGNAGGGDSRVTARCDYEMDILAMRAQGMLRELGDTAVFERLGRL